MRCWALWIGFAKGHELKYFQFPRAQWIDQSGLLGLSMEDLNQLRSAMESCY